MKSFFSLETRHDFEGCFTPHPFQPREVEKHGKTLALRDVIVVFVFVVFSLWDPLRDSCR